MAARLDLWPTTRSVANNAMFSVGVTQINLTRMPLHDRFCCTTYNKQPGLLCGRLASCSEWKERRIETKTNESIQQKHDALHSPASLVKDSTRFYVLFPWIRYNPQKTMESRSLGPDLPLFVGEGVQYMLMSVAPLLRSRLELLVYGWLLLYTSGCCAHIIRNVY